MSTTYQLLLSLCVCICVVFCDVTNNNISDDDCNLSSDLVKEIQSYQPIVDKIIKATRDGRYKGGTYNELAKFVDKFGARVTGSKNLEDSIDYMLDLLKNYHLDNVHGEEVRVPNWVRGEEEGWLVEPRVAKIPILGLGSSISTPEDGIEAEALVVTSFEELSQPNFTTKAKGKIIVFNNEWVSYGVSVQYRSQGATEAAKHGAVAALVRSVTPYSQRTLHTGHQSYGDNVTKIPTACITVEDARFLQRLQDRGERIVIRIKMKSAEMPETTSRNTVAEIEGSENPEKVVLVSGHLDSWDVGVGAMDDGGGAFISWYGLAVLKGLNLTAKRTLRSVLWTGEEQGLIGVQAYDKTHKKDLDNFVFVMESDEGTFTPLGLEYTAGNQGGCIIQEILKLLAPINTTQAKFGQSVGSDISIWTSKGIPGASLLNQNEKYFWYHHTDADSLDIEDPDTLDKATALWASAAYIIADLSIDFPRENIDSLTNNEKITSMSHFLKTVQKPK